METPHEDLSIGKNERVDIATRSQANGNGKEMKQNSLSFITCVI